MRDEVLIKRQLVAMVTWIWAKKSVGENCLLGDGKKRGNRGEREGGRLRGTAESQTQSSQAERSHVVFLPPSKIRDSGDHCDPSLFSKLKYSSLSVGHSG